MGYHPNCTVSTCSRNCCNFAGTCPSTSSGCVYYYYGTSENKNNGGTIGGAVTGAIVGLIILIIIICYCYKKRQQ